MPVSEFGFLRVKIKKTNITRTWRNWQTRRFQVPVGNTVWVQIPSSAPRKGDNFDTKSIEIIALFVAFRGIFTLFSAFDGSFDR